MSIGCVRAMQVLVNTLRRIIMAWLRRQTVVFALFAGRDEVARELVEGFAERRLRPQIEADGRQPRELARRRHSAIRSITLPICSICALSPVRWTSIFYDAADGAIDRAIGYLTQFLGNRDAFPYKQIKDWHGVEQTFAQQLLRASESQRESRISPVVRTVPFAGGTETGVVHSVERIARKSAFRQSKRAFSAECRISWLQALRSRKFRALFTSGAMSVNAAASK